MPQELDRDGAFRFKVIEHTVGSTKNGFPQWNAVLEATEFYDPDTEEWHDWSEYEMQIKAYLCLFNNEKALANYDQLQTAIGWDGASFAGLAAMDLSNVVFLGRVQEEEYNGKVQRKVQWVDHADANPAGGLKGLDTDGLKGLDAQFKHMLNRKPTAAPAKAPSKPAATAPPKPAAKAPKAPEAEPEAKAAPAPPKAKPKAKAPEKEAEAPAGCTKDEAWAAVLEACPDLSDDKYAKAWLDTCSEVAETIKFENEPDRVAVEDDFKPEHWGQVRNNAITALGGVPF